MMCDATFKLTGVPLLRRELLDEVDAYACRHGLALADAVCCLLKAGLDAENEAMLHYEREGANPFVG